VNLGQAIGEIEFLKLQIIPKVGQEKKKNKLTIMEYTFIT
jgi:hypothetical protein